MAITRIIVTAFCYLIIAVTIHHQAIVAQAVAQDLVLYCWLILSWEPCWGFSPALIDPFEFYL
eukprot:10680245-Prorocentrum_lima.AAC.1